MKLLLLVLSLLLLALLVAPAGHGAHHPPPATPSGKLADTQRPRPLRVVRSPAVARQHRLVRAVR
jgi:hypothetical protein